VRASATISATVRNSSTPGRLSEPNRDEPGPPSAVDENIRSVPEYAFTVTEHDPARPWIVLGQDHRSVMLDDGASFFEWAAERWPKPRWTVEVDPWQLSPVRAS
jgi:hypothetical protein